jgi:uncharacterized protein YdhG (YjbR/CyaY superfamily)
MEVDAYIAGVENEEARWNLERMRDIVREEAPDAQELISYGMPGYKLNGPLVYFAAFKKHISLFPAGRVAEFEDLLAGYATSKGTIQFPLGQPLPEELIRSIVRARIAQNRAKPLSKKIPSKK